jgi:hypothetical protein
MLIRISSVDDILPSLEALSELGISYKINDDNSIIIELNTPDFKVAENKDMPILLSSNCPNADSSLLYFVIKGHRIIASGDLQKVDENDYVCNGSFRVFSRINITTFNYIGASQIDISELDELNGKMLEATMQDKKMSH